MKKLLLIVLTALSLQASAQFTSTLPSGYTPFATQMYYKISAGDTTFIQGASGKGYHVIASTQAVRDSLANYYTKVAADARFVDLTTAQTIAGDKTFSSPIISPNYGLANVNGSFSGSNNTIISFLGIYSDVASPLFKVQTNGAEIGNATIAGTVTAPTFIGSLTGNATTVTTNANLTGVVTSVGNTTAIADSALSIAKTSGLQTALDSKQATLSGTGIIKSTGGTISYLTDNSANWNTAYTYSQVGHLPLTGGTMSGVTKISGASVGSGSERWIGTDGGAGSFFNAPASLTLGINNNSVIGLTATGAGVTGLFSVSRSHGASVKTFEVLNPGMTDNEQMYSVIGKSTAGSEGFYQIYNHNATAASRYISWQGTEVGPGATSLKLYADGVTEVGGLRLTAGASNGYVLKSDASGNASWQSTTSSYKGTWNASANTPTIADGSGATGDYYEVSTSGTQFGRSFSAGGRAIYNGSIWEPVGVSASVTSVNSLTGSVQINTTLSGNNFGLTGGTTTVDISTATGVANKLPLAGGDMSGAINFTGASIGSASNRWIGTNGATGMFLNTPTGTVTTLGVNNAGVLDIASGSVSSSVPVSATQYNINSVSGKFTGEGGTTNYAGIYTDAGVPLLRVQTTGAGVGNGALSGSFSASNFSGSSTGTNTGDQNLAPYAPLASPTFTGTVSGITAAMVGAPSGSGTSTGTNTGDQNLAPYATLASPALTGTPTAPTATAGTNTTQVATTAYVDAAVVAGTSGTYTPVASSLSDITSVVMGVHHYTRVGNEVTVYGSLDGVSTTNQPILKITIPPISISWSATTDLVGFGIVNTTGFSSPGGITKVKLSASVADGKALIYFGQLGPTVVGGSHNVDYSFTFTAL